MPRIVRLTQSDAMRDRTRSVTHMQCRRGGAYSCTELAPRRTGARGVYVRVSVWRKEKAVAVGPSRERALGACV